MSGLLLPIAVGVAATLPAAALGLTVARIAEPLLRTAAPRSRMWSVALGLTLATGVSAALWPIPKPVTLPAATVMVVPTSRIAVPVAASPVWHFDLTPWVSALLLAILVGAALNLMLLAGRLLQARRLVTRARPLDDAALQAGLARHAARLGVAAPPLLVSETARTAMLVGFGRPVIVLPVALATQTDRTALGLICAHELVHQKRGDHWRALADRMITAALWFNPFALAIVRRQVAVREELCDLAVLSGAGPTERRLYAATLVEALRLAGPQSLHPSFIRRKGGGHAMRLKAILHPAAKPRAASWLAAGGLLLLAAAASLSAGAVLAQAADRAEGAAGSSQRAGPTASGAVTYLVSIKLYDGEKIVASPRLTVAEGQPARVEIGSDESVSYKVVVTTERIDKEHDDVQAHAAFMKGGVKSEIAWPHITIQRGGSTAFKIAGKISMTISPLDDPDGGLGAERRLETATSNEHGSDARISAGQVKYKDATASDMQRYCASGEARDGGWCAGVMFGFAPNETIAKANGICPPTGVLDNAALTRARQAIAAAIPRTGETAGAFARSVLAQTFTCPGWRVSRSDKASFSGPSIDISADRVTSNNVAIYEGHPAITGAENGANTILLDGKPTPEGFKISSIKSDQIARIEVHTNNAGPKPHNVINVITKPL